MDATQPGLDGSTGDTGGPGTEELTPGLHATFREGRVSIGDSFGMVKGTIGNPARRSMGMLVRSYEWTLASGPQVTIWFANTNLDSDDNPPANVDDTDQVLWIAVNGTFGGHTMEGLGLGSMKTAVQTAYGPSPHTVTVTTAPMGTVETYYTRGVIFTYDPNSSARTVTICRAYTHEPDGAVDVVNMLLDFGNPGRVETGPAIGGGTQRTAVRTLLGAPDAEGDVQLGNVTLHLFSYSFIGMEVFFTPQQVGGQNVFFVSVHPPYYGTMGAGNPSFGATRMDFEAYLAGQNFAPGVNSTVQMGVVCYKRNNSMRAIGVTYTTDMPPKLAGVILGYPLSPIGSNCQ